MTGTLRPQMSGRDGPELGVNQRQELLERAVIPLLPGPEILGDLFDYLMIQGVPWKNRNARQSIRFIPTEGDEKKEGIMSQNVELESGAEYNFLGCHVTIFNLSRYMLKNVQYSAASGTYYWTPASLIKPACNDSTTIRLLGAPHWPTGSEGICTYEVGDFGTGSVSFLYSCPASGFNYGTKKNDTADAVLLEVYGQLGTRIGMVDGWGFDPKNWGTEGSIPNSEHPLALLFVVRDYK